MEISLPDAIMTGFAIFYLGESSLLAFDEIKCEKSFRRGQAGGTEGR